MTLFTPLPLVILKRVPLLITFDSLLSTRKHLSALLHSTFLCLSVTFCVFLFFSSFFNYDYQQSRIINLFIHLVHSYAVSHTLFAFFLFSRIPFYCSCIYFLRRVEYFCAVKEILPFFSLPFARCTILSAKRYFLFFSLLFSKHVLCYEFSRAILYLGGTFIVLDSHSQQYIHQLAAVNG